MDFIKFSIFCLWLCGLFTFGQNHKYWDPCKSLGGSGYKGGLISRLSAHLDPTPKINTLITKYSTEIKNKIVLQTGIPLSSNSTVKAYMYRQQIVEGGTMYFIRIIVDDPNRNTTTVRNFRKFAPRSSEGAWDVKIFENISKNSTELGRIVGPQKSRDEHICYF